MKRSGPLRRTTGLKRTPMRRRKSKRLLDYESEFLIAAPLVHVRDNHTCQFHDPDGTVSCSGKMHVHHIRPRGRGGGNELENLILVCGKAHEWIHQHPRDAQDMGFTA